MSIVFPSKNLPVAFDPNVQKRSFTMVASAETLERMRKRGDVQGFAVMCDEGPRTGGDSTAPSPLGYFLSAVAFCLLTQISRYGHMKNISFTKARVDVTADFRYEGSALRGDVEAFCDGVRTEIHVESEEPETQVKELLRVAGNACFVMQSLVKPVCVEQTLRITQPT